MSELAERILKAGVLVAQTLRSTGCDDVLPGRLASILRTLHVAGPVGQGALLTASRHEPEVAHGLLDELAQRGLVTVEPGADGEALVRLTAAGKAAYARCQAMSVQPMAQLLQALDERDVQLLEQGVALLERLADEPRPAAVNPPLTPR